MEGEEKEEWNRKEGSGIEQERKEQRRRKEEIKIDRWSRKEED